MTDVPAAQRPAVIAALASLVTPERLERMRTVLARRTRHVCVALEEIYQGHNASAILRSCEGFGVQDVHVIEGRNAFQANDEIALGATNWLTLHRHRGGAGAGRGSCLAALRARGYRIVATALGPGAVPISELPVDRPLALGFGTEKEGLSAEFLAAADARAQIPMSGFTQSFNVSVSAAICLHEVTTRLRRDVPGWELAPAEQEELLLRWLLAANAGAESIARGMLG